MESEVKKKRKRQKRSRSKQKYRNKRQRTGHLGKSELNTSSPAFESPSNNEEIIDLENGVKPIAKISNNRNQSMKQFTKFTLEEEQKILETKNSYFKLEMNSKRFKELVEETIDKMNDPNERIAFKKKSVYFSSTYVRNIWCFDFSNLLKSQNSHIDRL